MRKLTALIMALLFAAGNLSAQDAGEGAQVVTFRFVAGNDMFYIPWAGNDAALERLCALIGENPGGMLPVSVEGYCVSLPTAAENLRMAFVRSNRVKSELITRRGLKETDFVTANYARPFDGLRDVVVVTLRIPADAPADNAPLADNAADTITDTVTVTDTVILSETKDLRPQGTPSSDTSVILSETKDLQPRSAEHEMLHSVQHDSKEGVGHDSKGSAEHEMVDPALPYPICSRSAKSKQALSLLSLNRKFHSVQHDKGKGKGKGTGKDNDNDATVPPYCFALRTNLLYDAMLLPTLGVEWRINSAIGIRLDGSLAHWGGNGDKVQKVWVLNPEVRWYLLADKRLYAGVSGSFGRYNIYKYPLGSLLSGDTGYQGKLWNAGLSVGYQLRLSRCFSADFNLGMGYTRSEYDSFTMTDGTRVGKERNKSKNLWGPTQAGISLVWTIGNQ